MSGQLNRACCIEGCDRPFYARTWCSMHYQRWRKYGSADVTWGGRNKRLGRPCCVEDCSKVVTNESALGMCGMHYQRVRAHGSPDVVGHGGASQPLESNPNWTGDEASYTAVHLRLRKLRGRAQDQFCVDCGDPAAHWSYSNADPNERVEPTLGRYSTDLSHYSPRCVPCHRTFDNAARRSAIITGRQT